MVILQLHFWGPYLWKGIFRESHLNKFMSSIWDVMLGLISCSYLKRKKRKKVFLFHHPNDGVMSSLSAIMRKNTLTFLFILCHLNSQCRFYLVTIISTDSVSTSTQSKARSFGLYDSRKLCPAWNSMTDRTQTFHTLLSCFSRAYLNSFSTAAISSKKQLSRWGRVREMNTERENVLESLANYKRSGKKEYN